MARKSSPIRKLLSPYRIIIAILFGLAVATWLVVRNFDKEAFALIQWSWYSTWWLSMAILMMGVRDFAYMIRIRVLTDYELSWKQSFQVILLWEFASAITPSVVGGSAVAVFIINKEGIHLGRSTAVVMVSALMDELFYISLVPLLLIFIGTANLFPLELEESFFGFILHIEGIFWTGYGFIVMLTGIILLGLFFKPQGFKTVLVWLFSLPYLKKWRAKAAETGDEIITTSKELKNKPKRYWIQAMAATYCSWFARFWVINCIILAFTPVGEHMLIYTRQLVMWVIMLISPTPGSAGVAEFAFSGFLKEFVPKGLDGTLALLWRLISYYPYLFIGAILLPAWIRRVYLKRKLISFKKT